MRNDELIRLAEGVIHGYRTAKGRLFGDVGAAVLSETGNVYVGTCVDTPGWTMCGTQRDRRDDYGT